MVVVFNKKIVRKDISNRTIFINIYTGRKSDTNIFTGLNLLFSHLSFSYPLP